MANLNQWAASIADGTGCFITKQEHSLCDKFVDFATSCVQLGISDYPARIVRNVSQLGGSPVRVVIKKEVDSTLLNMFYGENPNVTNTVIKNRVTVNTQNKTTADATKQTILESMPRLYPIFKTVSEIIGDNTGLFFYQVDVNVIQSLSLSSIVISKKYTQSEFLAFASNFKCLQGVDFYTNLTGVSQQTKIGSQDGYDVVVPYLTDMGSDSSFDPSTSASYLSLLTSIITKSVKGDSYSTSSKKWANVIPNGLFYYIVSKNEYEVNQSFSLTASFGGRNAFITSNNDGWTQALNDIGLPWDFDLTKVMAGDYIPKPGDDPAPEPDPDNPTDPGGGGSENPSTDPVVYPNPGYIPSGCFNRYWLDDSQVKSFKDFLFSSGFWNDVARLVTNPIDYVIDLTYYPIRATGLTNGTGSNAEIYCGNVDSKISAPILPDNNRPTIWGGSLNYKYGDKASGPYYGSYLDYDPYTSISLYIPYIGVREMNVSMVTNHVICLMYVLDFNSRTFTAIVGLDGNKNNMNPGQIVAQYTAPFGVNYPLSGTDMQRQVLNMATATAQSIQAIGSVVTGFAGGGVAGGALATLGAVGSLAGAANTAQTSPTITGTMSPVSGLYAPQVPYFLINTPSRARPADFDKYAGLSTSYTGKVSSFASENGAAYLRCKEVYLNQSRYITETEATEIINLLKGGIYVN